MNSFFVHDISPIIIDISLEIKNFNLKTISLIIGFFLLIFVFKYLYVFLKGKKFKIFSEFLSYLIMGIVSVIILQVLPIDKLSIRYYGLLFGLAAVMVLFFLRYLFKSKGYKISDSDDYILYLLLGIIIGIRLVHVIFYNPSYYFSNPIKILKIWEGGLASHGAVLGVIVATFIYAKKNNYSFYKLTDLFVIPASLGTIFIRFGNFINSEIVGRVTDLPWGVVFVRYDYPKFIGKSDNLPTEDLILRHPSQIYEMIYGIVVFLILFWLYKKYRIKLQKGVLSYTFLAVYFMFRFLVEFVKEYQTLTDSFFTMGQYLSFPFFLVGTIMIIRLQRTRS